MKKKGIVILLIIAVIVGISGYFLIPRILEGDLIGDDFFDPGTRYDWDRLDYMDVIFENETDIYTVNGAWSTTNSCPWARTHLGFDFALNNNSKVLIAAPGQVTQIRLMDWGSETENRYMVGVEIRFNNSVYVNYGFEPWTTNLTDHEHQQRLINVSVGDWVEIGQEIGRFLNVGPGAHIHFDVIEDGVRTRLDRYYSLATYTRMMELVHMWHHEWPYLCYDETTPLDYANTTFLSKSHINNVVNVYSNTTDCPWFYVHKGFDFYFNLNQRFFSAAPGQVDAIYVIDRGSGLDRYAINITITFNSEIQCEYILELYTNSLIDIMNQLSKIYITEGEWIMLGWGIGDFQQISVASHIHFAIREKGEYLPLDRYFSSTAYDLMMDLIHDYEPSWNYLCYTGQPW
ncbi:MAG: M23 family metallopeptidase [Promethearchaeota archaeon]